MIAAALDWIAANPKIFLDALLVHLVLSLSSLALGIGIGVPAGTLLARHPKRAVYAINAAGMLRTLPSLAILALMLPLLGTGFLPSFAALSIYALPPILVNAYTGVREVDADIVDAAAGMGMTRTQIALRVELPLAAPVIFAGIRTAGVQTIAGATLAAFIGGGGLGDFITAGIAIMDTPRLLVGAVPVALLAVAAELLFGGIEKAMRRRQGAAS